MKTENEIRKEICDFLSTFPDRCLFTVNAKARGKFVSKHWPPKGWPDISGMWAHAPEGLGAAEFDSRAVVAVPLFIEVKTPEGKVFQEQIEFRDKARKMGAIAFFATSVEDVRKELGV